MSKNHDNVTWQSKDKTWNRGFFDQTRHGSEADGFDPEWDVDYDFGKFENVFTGYATKEAVTEASYRMYGNAGGTTIIVPSKANAAEIADYERMAAWCKNPELEAAAKKKEDAKLKRAHTEKMKGLFIENKDFKGQNVRATVKMDDQSWTVMGMSKTYIGYVKLEGDWLVVNDGKEKLKLKNVVTGRFNRKLHSIERSQSSYYNRSY